MHYRKVLFTDNLRHSLETDMKDPTMAHWTTPPNLFLVAELKGLVVGSIAFQQKSLGTLEMNRLSVHSDFRGHKIGLKLVEALLIKAKSMGYKKICGQTSEYSAAPMKLFHNTGFHFSHHPENALIYTLNGIKLFAYEKMI